MWRFRSWRALDLPLLAHAEEILLSCASQSNTVRPMPERYDTWLAEPA